MKGEAMKRIVLFIILNCSIGHFASSQGRMDGTLLRRIDKEVLKSMDEGGIPGLSLVVIDSGQEIIKTYGYSNLEDKRRVTTNTLFQLGSCSKAFTALAVMKLVNEGVIDLNAYVSDYIPWFQ